MFFVVGTSGRQYIICLKDSYSGVAETINFKSLFWIFNAKILFWWNHFVKLSEKKNKFRSFTLSDNCHPNSVKTTSERWHDVWMMSSGTSGAVKYSRERKCCLIEFSRTYTWNCIQFCCGTMKWCANQLICNIVTVFPDNLVITRTYGYSTVAHFHSHGPFCWSYRNWNQLLQHILGKCFKHC